MVIKHIIFDCDGVLVDSEPLSMRIDVEILAENGVILSEAEAHKRFVGKTFAAMIAEVEREFRVAFPADASAQKDQRLLELYGRELKAVSGVSDALKAMGLGYSVASNSPHERVVEALRLTALSPFFGNRITTFEHVSRPKPAPDVYIEAARRAGVKPDSCLVVEDSATGVTSAMKAGCWVLGFTGTHQHPEQHGEMLKDLGAEAVFARMVDLPPLVETFTKLS